MGWRGRIRRAPRDKRGISLSLSLLPWRSVSVLSWNAPQNGTSGYFYSNYTNSFCTISPSPGSKFLAEKVDRPKKDKDGELLCIKNSHIWVITFLKDQIFQERSKSVFHWSLKLPKYFHFPWKCAQEPSCRSCHCPALVTLSSLAGATLSRGPLPLQGESETGLRMLIWGPRGGIILQKDQSTKSQLHQEDFTLGCRARRRHPTVKDGKWGAEAPKSWHFSPRSCVTLSKPTNNCGPQFLIYELGILVTALSAAETCVLRT